MRSLAKPGPWRESLLWAVVIAPAVLTGAMLLRETTASGGFNPQDFVEYWGAGRLNAAGQNPYDAHDLFVIERAVSTGLTDAIMMWNPPWTLAIAMPFGLLPAALSHCLWIALQMALLLIAVDRLWRLYDGPVQLRWLAWIVALGFAPSFFVLRMGQIGPLILLGVVGFLYFERRGQGAWAGACLALATVKPHLVLLLGGAVILWVIQRRRWSVLAGGTATLLAATAVALAANPEVVRQYLDAMSHRPPEMLSPTLGTLLRLTFGVEHFRLQFVPMALGLVWLPLYWLRHRRHWVWTARAPVLLLAGFLTASYGAWPFDFVVLLVPVLQVLTRVARRPQPAVVGLALLGYLGFNILALLLMNIRYTDYYWYAWMTPMLLYCYLVLQSQTRSEAGGEVRLAQA